MTVLASTTDLTIIKAVAGSQVTEGDVYVWAVRVARAQHVVRLAINPCYMALVHG